MKLDSIVRLVVVSLSLASNGWAIDHFNRQSFDTDNLRYEYKADLDCEVTDVQGTNLSFKYDKSASQIHALFNDTEFSAFSPIDNLNSGKTFFTACRADGVRGYRENESYNNRIVKKTIIHSTGKHCVGIKPKSSEDVSFEFVKNKVVMRLVYANYEEGLVSDLSCSFTRIQF